MLCSRQEPRADAAAHERGRRARPLRARVRQGRVDDAVQHVPPLHGGRASDPHRRRAVRHRARRWRPSRIRCRPRSSRPSRTGARSTWRPSCTTSPRGAPRTTRSSGARIARTLCPRFGMSAAETETVAWLIEQHLLMSSIAFSRDIGDPKTIRDFANIVQSPERLKLLLVLTVADIRAVGPSVWNGWKGQLLRGALLRDRAGGGRRPHAARLARPHRRGPGRLPRRRRRLARRGGRALHRPALSRLLAAGPRRARSSSMPSSCARAEQAGEKLASDFTTDAFTAITELSLFAPNHPRLLALFAGACAASGANISGAHISTTRDGFALDTFLLAREFDHDEDELRRARRIAETIEQAAEGRDQARRADGQAARAPGPARAPSRWRPRCSIDNALSNQFTVIEVAGLDRPGLLFELTNTLSDLNLDITSRAHHHLRREGRRRVLRHRPHQQEDHQPAAPARPSASACWACWAPPSRRRADRCQTVRVTSSATPSCPVVVSSPESCGGLQRSSRGSDTT